MFEISLVCFNEFSVLSFHFDPRDRPAKSVYTTKTVKKLEEKAMICPLMLQSYFTAVGPNTDK